MPDPLDLTVDIGPGNNYLEDIRLITQEELQRDPSLLALNPCFLGSPQQDPLEILMQCEEQDEIEGCTCGTNLQQYFDTHINSIIEEHHDKHLESQRNQRELPLRRSRRTA